MGSVYSMALCCIGERPKPNENPLDSAMKKKIAIVSPTFPPFGKGGGVQASHYNLFRAFKEKGYVVKAFTWSDREKGRGEDDVCRGGALHCLLPPSRKAILFGQKIWQRFVVKEKGIRFQFADALLGAFRGLGLYRKIKSFAPDIIIVPDHGAPSALWPKMPDRKIVFMSHNNPARFLDEPLFGLHSKSDAEWAVSIENKAISKADVVVCPSQYMASIFSKTYQFDGEVEVVHNLIDNALIDEAEVSNMRQFLGLSDEDPLVYIPSAGSRFKGERFVFEIVRRLSSGYEGIVGFYLSGEINVTLKRCLEFLPSNARLYCPGKVDYLENIRNVKACTLCVSPTLIESFGMAILEAQRCGLPVVAFDCGGVSEILVDRVTGFLVPYLEVEAIVQNSMRIMLDRDLCVEMSEKAKNHAMLNFNSDLVLHNFERIFERFE